MRPMNYLLIGAILAAAPVLGAPEALADDDDGSEACGTYEISDETSCELLTGDECEEQCDETDTDSQSEAICADACEGGGIEALKCFVTCLPQILLALESSCYDGCSGDGSLFCDETYLPLEDTGPCVEQLCSMGMDMGEVCEQEGSTDPGSDNPGEPGEPGEPGGP